MSSVGPAPRIVLPGLALIAGLLLSITFPPAGDAAFVNFESHQIHPIVLSPDGTRLFAVNTPDGYLCVYSVGAGLPVLIHQIPVGLEPVSVAWRNSNEVWVANHLSDDVSIVDLTTWNVRATLLVGDEPTDIVFAGSPPKAFVCVSQEDAVKVYDPANLAAAPVVLPIFGADPRALAVNGDRTRVYAAVFESGNGTTIVPESTVVAQGGPPPPNPPMDPSLPPAPPSGLIVQYNGTDWVDEAGGIWTPFVPYTVADNDVAIIDASAPVPSVIGYYTGVGTLNFDVSVNPASNKLYVTNIDERNLIRFEGNLNGNFARNRITIIDPNASTVTPVHLNDHINYSVVPGPPEEVALSLSTPMAMAWNSAGSSLYMTALGSGKVAVLNSSGVVTDRWSVADGPTGLALNENNGVLYVLDRFPNNIKVVSTSNGAVTGQVGLGFDPEPPEIRNGRRFLYDARLTSGHGDVACSTCHAFGNLDHIDWDLGRPDGAFVPPPPGQPDTLLTGFHPMKGPMITQSLRGLIRTMPLHWRGDKADVTAFNGAFQNLQGRAAPLDAADINAFNDFVLTITYPPNPNEYLDRTMPNPSLQPSPTRGKYAFVTNHLAGGKLCVTCHAFPTGSDNLIWDAAVDNNFQDFNTPQLRNMYEKTGFQKTGVSKSGFGFSHDGSFDTLYNFFGKPFFTFGTNKVMRRDVEAFMMCWDTDLAPAAGAQQTIDASNKNTTAVVNRISTLISQADAGNIDLQVKGIVRGLARGYRYAGGNLFESDRRNEPMVDKDTLRSWADFGAELTYTGLPPGCGMRAIDRDGDGYRDRDELDAGSDPANPLSTPATTAVPIGGPEDQGLLGRKVLVLQSYPNPTHGAPSRIHFQLAAPARVTLRIFDAQGRLVRTLIDGVEHGVVETDWDLRDWAGRPMPSGVYFYRLDDGKFFETRRLTVLR